MRKPLEIRVNWKGKVSGILFTVFGSIGVGIFGLTALAPLAVVATSSCRFPAAIGFLFAFPDRLAFLLLQSLLGQLVLAVRRILWAGGPWDSAALLPPVLEGCWPKASARTDGCVQPRQLLSYVLLP